MIWASSEFKAIAPGLGPLAWYESSPAFTFSHGRFDSTKLHGIPHPHALAGAEAGSHLEDVPRGTSSTQLPLRIRYGVGLDTDHTAVLIDEYNVER